MGTNGTAPDDGASLLEARRAAVRIAEDRAEAWYYLGDTYFHDGALLGVDDAFRQADQAFKRAVEHDSTVAGTLQHLLLMAVYRGDTAEVRRWARLTDAAEGDSTIGSINRWMAALALGDTVALNVENEAFVSRMREGGSGGGGALMLPFATQHLSDFIEFHRRLEEAAALRTTRESVARSQARLLWEAGRPSEAAEAARRGDMWPLLRVQAALFSSGDSLDGARAYQELVERAADAGAAGPNGSELCAAALWDFEHRRPDRVDAAMRQLRDRNADRNPNWPPIPEMVCSQLLDAATAQRRGDADAGERINRLDRLLLTRPYRLSWENLFLARLLEGEGEYARASAAAGRFAYFIGGAVGRPLAPTFREAGRLAELAGDTERAIDQYSRYLTLRSDPEPSVQPEVDEVRRALARLTGER
jgi:hypothetical protein